MNQFLQIFIFLPLLGSAQTTQESFSHLFRAEAFYRNSVHPDSAIYYYQQSFDQGITDISAVLDAISCAGSIQDTAAMTRFMTFGLRHGLEVDDYRRLWLHVGSGEDVDLLLSRIDTQVFSNAYLSQLDLELIRELSVLAHRDQKVREKENPDFQEMRKADSINSEALKKIVLRLGHLPFYHQIGLEGSEHLNILFYHMGKEDLEYFIPFVVDALRQKAFFDARVILYQLDRMGMADNCIYFLSPDLKIVRTGPRTRLIGEYVCQSFGEWFHEKNPLNGLVYFVPIDPSLTMEEVNRVRQIFYLDNLENYWARHPWLQVVSREEFLTAFSN